MDQINYFSDMDNAVRILKKPEIYSFDELNGIKEFCAARNVSEQTIDALNKMMESIQTEKDSKAVFFMPENTFAIFSLIQGDNSICEITLKNVEEMISALENELSENKNAFRNHLAAKLNVLRDFLKAGNAAKPVPSQADCFETIQV